MSDGLMFGCRLDGQGGGEPIDLSEFESESSGHTVWAHLDWQDDAAKNWIRRQSWLNPMAADALLDVGTRPRVVEFPDGLLVNLRGVNLNEGAQADDMVSMRIWIGTDRIISTRRRRLLTPRELYEETIAGNGITDTNDFIKRMLERLNEKIGPIIDGIADDIDVAEDRFAVDISAYRGEFGQLRRRTAALRRYLGPQRDCLEKLSRLAHPVINDSTRDCAREAADEVTRYLEDLDLAREQSMVAQEELLNRMAQQQNDRVYILSLVAALFLPLSFLTGVFGMNVGGLPGLENPDAFLWLSGMMLVLAAGILLGFRLQRWL
jgi:zinc transporter